MKNNSRVIIEEESKNEWYECKKWDNCTFLDIRPDGDIGKCPNCGSSLHKYTGPLFTCTKCKTKHRTKQNANMCC